MLDRYKILFDEVKIGPVTAPNRFFAVPHATGYAWNQPSGAIAIRAMKAEGGWGTVAVQITEISPDSDFANHPMERIWDDTDILRHAKGVEQIKKHGSLSAIELGHGGMRARNILSGSPVIGPSALPILKPEVPVQSKMMDLSDIKVFREKHKNAVKRSVKAGYDVQKASHTKFIDMALELGGKDPAYVRADCNFDHAVENLVDGSYYNSGQSCCGIERIYVDEKIFDNFVDAFKTQTEKYILNNPLDNNTNLGPVVKLSAANNIRNQVSKALNNGAKNIIDESKFKIDNSDNCYVSPSALINVDHSMEFMMEETFGPTVGIMKVKNDNEAEQLMNDSPYGLTASIWTSDKNFATLFGNKIQTGTFFMNRCDYLDPGLAWTGVKDTGMGVTLSVLGFDHLTRAKSYHLRKV